MKGDDLGQRFATVRSGSADLTLDRVVERLRACREVVAVVLIGSTAGRLKEWSDIDLFVVLADGPAFDVEFGTIDGRPADIVFTDLDSIRRIANADAALDGRLLDLSAWLGGGRVAFSRSDDVALAVEAARARGSRRSGDQEQFFRWVELNVNLIKFERYVAAGTPEHLEALHLMLDQAFAALPQDALVLAGTGWTGERPALQELRRSGGEVLRAIEAGRAEPNAARRLAIYRSAATRVAEPAGGLWSGGETAGGWILRGDGRTVNSRWEELMEDR